jgi:hypothetical protein
LVQQLQVAEPVDVNLVLKHHDNAIAPEFHRFDLTAEIEVA